MKWPTPKFDLGTIVYPKVAPVVENAGMVTGYTVRDGGHFSYLVARGDGDEKEAVEMELTDEIGYQA